ncbi:MAG TPA: hypothetical protein VHN98_04485 [Acidimicrobiales bacterium]|nr:hypothetical protein [Acidimicrobiales bacterium]
MTNETWVDEANDGRKFFVDFPSDADERDELTFLLNLHGGGSVGMWQRAYFPAHDFADELGIVVATPSSKTKQPMSHWVAEADDDHLKTVVGMVADRFGSRLRSFWLVGHSQGGMTSNRLLRDPWWADRVDGWLSLSGGRVGPAPFVKDFGPPRTEAEREAMAELLARRRGAGFGNDPALHEADFSFVFAVGEHEIESLPSSSPWAERYGAGPRQQLADVVDEAGGQVHDGRFEGRYKNSWGREPRGGVAKVWVYPNARDGRVIADVVRVDKGHTEGLEPNITRRLLELVTGAPGGKLASAGAR